MLKIRYVFHYFWGACAPKRIVRNVCRASFLDPFLRFYKCLPPAADPFRSPGGASEGVEGHVSQIKEVEVCHLDPRVIWTYKL